MRIKVRGKPADAYQHGHLREALVQAGLKLLTEGGVQCLSLRAAAQLAGVSHAAPYRHFADKDALMSAIAEQGFRLLTAAMRNELAKIDCAQDSAVDDRARLRAIGAGYVGFACSHPAYLRVIFGGVVDKSSLSPELCAAGDAAFGVLLEVVEQGMASGDLRLGDANSVALACWAMVHGLSMLLIEKVLDRPGQMPPAPELLLDTVVRLLEAGIAA